MAHRQLGARLAFGPAASGIYSQSLHLGSQNLIDEGGHRRTPAIGEPGSPIIHGDPRAARNRFDLYVHDAGRRFIKQGSKASSQDDPLARLKEGNAHVLDTSTAIQLLAKASTGPHLKGHSRRITGICMGLVPPILDLAEGSEGLLRGDDQINALAHFEAMVARAHDFGGSGR